MSSITLIDIPIEILYSIFDRLDIQTLIGSIRFVCKRFYTVLNNYNRISLDLTSISQSHIQLVSRLIRPENIISIYASDNNEETSHNIDSFFSLVPVHQLTRLRSLTLGQITEKNLNRFLTHISTYSLISLTVDSYRLNDYSVSSFDLQNRQTRIKTLLTILSRTFAQYNRLQMLHLENSSYRITDISWPDQYLLSYLSIRECDFDNYFLILRRLRHLKTFLILCSSSHCTPSKSLLSPADEYYSQLSSLTIEDCEYSAEQLKLLLPFTPSLVYLKLCSPWTDFDSKFDGYFWEKLIQTKLPMLNKFEFLFAPSLADVDNTPSLESIITTFRSPFWMHKKHWLVVCNFGIESQSDSYRLRLGTTSYKMSDCKAAFKCEVTTTNTKCLLTRPWMESTNEKSEEHILTNLNLSRNISRLGVKYLAEGLHSNMTVHTLTLEYSSINDAAVQHLAEMLKANMTLISLNLRYNEIGEQGAKYLANALLVNKALNILDLSHNQIMDQGVYYFSDALQYNTILIKINLSDNQISDQGVDYLTTALQKNTTLINLELGQNTISNAGIQYLASALLKNTTLTTLNLEYNLLDNIGATYLANILKQNTTLTTLDLGHNNITEQGVQQLATALENNIILNTLILQYTSTEEQGAKYLSDVMQKKTGLSVLDLGWSGTGNQGVLYLADALNNNNTILTTLILADNEIDIQGTQYLANALYNNKTLTVLNLRINRINSEAAKYLAGGLRNNTTLTTLNLDYNEIKKEGTKYLADALQDNKALTELDLGRNGIGDDGARYLADVLHKNTTLTTLILSDNGIGDQGAQHFAVALKHNKTLTTLALDFNKIQTNGLYYLAEIVRNHPILTTLDLSGNRIGNTGAQYIADILQDNTILTTLDIHNTGIFESGPEILVEAMEKNTTITTLVPFHGLITTELKRISYLLERNANK